MRSYLIVSLLALSLVALSSPARAEQEPGKDRNTATMLSLGGTAVGGVALYLASQDVGGGTMGLVAIGSLVLLPSMGQVYSEQYGSGLLQVATRGAGVGLTILAIDQCFWRECDGVIEIAGVAGLGLFAGGTLWSMIDAAHAADRYNEENRITLSPMMVTVADEQGMGLGLVGTF